MNSGGGKRPFTADREHLFAMAGYPANSMTAAALPRGRERLVTDGPFTETKKLIAGYCLLQFTSLHQALEWTRRFVQVDAPGRLGGECECELRECVE